MKAIPADVILMLTSGCERGECRVVAEYRGGTMLGGASAFYNRDGVLIVEDPNAMDVQLECKTCARGCVVHRNSRRHAMLSDGGESDE